MAGFAIFTLGGLALATALFRGRAVPVAGVAAYVVLVVSQFTRCPVAPSTTCRS